MALKALLLGNELKCKRKALSAMEARAEELSTRETQLAAAIDEVETDEQRAQVQEMVTAFEADRDAYTQERQALESAIAELETQLREEEARQDTTPPAGGNPSHDPTHEPEEERSMIPMNTTPERAFATTRDRVFRGMNRAQQQELIQRSEVQNFLSTVKACMRSREQSRSIQNVGLLIPEVMLGLIRDSIVYYSKLSGHITTSAVKGEGVELFTDEIPEAVWTECCANLNELTMGFFQGRYGCWKLGGFFVACNANLEDSDLDLTAEIISTLGQSVAITKDKTIIYGTGSNMPLGIVPRLAQESKPAGYPATARPWVDLHETNIITISGDYVGLALFRQLVLASAAAKSKNSRGEKVWAMNEYTHKWLIAQAMGFDASGAIVAGMNNTMPVVGGVIEELPDSIMPDFNIVMGYMDHYRMMERAGVKFATSEEYFFLSDQTVFKVNCRMDGHPTIPESFVLIGLNGVTPATSATFRGDGANEPTAVLLPATATVAAGQKIQLRATILPFGVDTALTWTSATPAKATVNANGEVTGVAEGSSVITVTTGNGLTAQCTVTVTA